VTRDVLAAVALLLMSASPALAQDDALLGRWRTPAQNGVVAIERCGAALCARVIDDPALRHRPVRGLTVVRAVSGGPQVWRAGPLYDPDSGQGAATGTLTLIDADRLAVRGCVARMLCRIQTWTRVR